MVNKKIAALSYSLLGSTSLIQKFFGRKRITRTAKAEKNQGSSQLVVVNNIVQAGRLVPDSGR